MSKGFYTLLIIPKPLWLVVTTKYENPPLPPFGKWGMGGFSYKKSTMKKLETT